MSRPHCPRWPASPTHSVGRTAVLDGELVAGAGRAEDFYALTPRMTLGPRRAGRGCRVTFVAFGVLFLDGSDACSQPYVEHRALLKGLKASGSLLARHRLCLDLGVEGLIAKRTAACTSDEQPGGGPPTATRT